MTIEGIAGTTQSDHVRVTRRAVFERARTAMRLLYFGTASRPAPAFRYSLEKQRCAHAQAKRANRAEFRLRDSTKSMRRAIPRQSPVAAAYEIVMPSRQNPATVP
jgi:hypothetical protein